MPPPRTAYGRLPEWPKGAVCKTVGSAYVGSNPTPATHLRRSKPVTRDCVTGFSVPNERLRKRSAVSRGLCVPFLLCPAVCHRVALWTGVSRCPRTYSGRRPAAWTVGVHRRLSTDGRHGRAALAACPGLTCAAESGVHPGVSAWRPGRERAWIRPGDTGRWRRGTGRLRAAW